MAVAGGEPDGLAGHVVGSLTARGLDPTLRRALTQPPPRRRLSAALSPDGLVLMIRAHRVLVIPNPYRATDLPDES